MNPPSHPRFNERGSVLFVTLVFAGILVLTLGSYFWWVRTQNILVAESQAWNAALANAEAGIEEAMSEINVSFGTNYIATLNPNGWSGPSSGTYGPRTNSLSRGSYSVVISNDFPPSIYTTGFSSVPEIGQPISRRVKVTTTYSTTFPAAMVALNKITFNGNTIYIDSYDSSDTNHSLAGRYSYPLRKAGGDVATQSGVVSIGNADIKGKLMLGPSGSYSLGPQGSVGDLNWNTSGQIENGWLQNDFNMAVHDVTLPSDESTWVPPTAGVTNTYLLGTGGYVMSGNLNLKTGDSMLVVGNASLFVGGSVSMSGQSTITIAPGASLKIYVAGSSASFTTVNTSPTATAAAFQYYGLPSNTSLSWSGNAQYVGTVYAPEADFTLNGGGSSASDYQGSCVVKNITMTGSFNFHYDEALKTLLYSGFTLASWREW